MYCDTDSVIYIQPNWDGLQLIETVDKLLDMTSELRTSEAISEFVSGVPKYYAYRVLTGDGRDKTVCKVRGITLNYNASQMVNLEVIRNMILRGNNVDEPAVVNVHTGRKIKRKKKGQNRIDSHRSRR